MKDRKKENEDPNAEKRNNADKGDQHTHDEACRCKETSTMTPGELVKLMMQDLAFWKKGKKG